MLKRARQQPEKYLWLTRLLARKPFRVVAVALSPTRWRASAWALLAKGGHLSRASTCGGSGVSESVDGRMRFASVCSRTAGVMTTWSRPSIGKTR